MTKIIKIENKLNKKRKQVSQINLTNTHTKKKQYCKTDSLFHHLGLQSSGWSFCFETPGPVGQQSSWLFWHLGFYLIRSTINPELLRSGSVTQRASDQTWKRNLQKTNSWNAKYENVTLKTPQERARTHLSSQNLLCLFFFRCLYTHSHTVHHHYYYYYILLCLKHSKSTRITIVIIAVTVILLA